MLTIFLHKTFMQLQLKSQSATHMAQETPPSHDRTALPS